MKGTNGVNRRPRPVRWLEDLARDVRHALRTLRKGHGYPLAAVTTLALAIGTSITMFSVLDAVLFEPLPYRMPDRLAILWTEDLTQDLRESRSTLTDVEQWRNQSRTFEDLATFDAVSKTLSAPEGAEQIVGASISPNLLGLLGVQPVRGRSFSMEDADAQQALVMIGHRFWQERFGGSDNAVGATIVLNGVPSEIIGVVAPSVEIATIDADVWEPNAMAGAGEARQDVRGGATWFVVGRLRSTATFDEAQVEMRGIATRLNDQLPLAERSRSVAIVPLSRYVYGPESRLALWMLAGAVCFVFLIAVANVVSLSLARGVARVREMAVRVALGASHARIVRQVLTESVLLAVVSGLIGTLLATVGVRLIRAFGPADVPRLSEMSLDARVLGWAFGLSLLSGIIVGLAPAVTTVRRELRPAGQEGGRNVSGGRSTSRTRRALVVVEFAIAIVLMVGAGLLLRSWALVTGVDPGFQPERVLAMRIATPTNSSEPAQRAELYGSVLREVRAVPGVESVGMIGDLWIASDREQMLTLESDEGIVSERVRLRRDEASADFFQAMGTPLLQGRFFAIADQPDSPRVAIVNETMARRSWPGQNPVGRRFKYGPPDSASPWYTVVGIVADMRRQGLELDAVPQIFESLAQNPPRSVEMFVRTSSENPLAMAGTLRSVVHGVERNAPIYAVAPLGQQLGNSLAQRRFHTSLLTGFAVMALLLAAVGIYGLMQYSVATRTQEIGLRVAVGAHPGKIFRLVLGEGLMLCLAGLAIGLVGAWWLGRAASSLLFGVTAGDPWTFATVSLLLTGAALVACYFPARRAVRLDPVAALSTT